MVRKRKEKIYDIEKKKNSKDDNNSQNQMKYYDNDVKHQSSDKNWQIKKINKQKDKNEDQSETNKQDQILKGSLIVRKHNTQWYTYIHYMWV